MRGDLSLHKSDNSLQCEFFRDFELDLSRHIALIELLTIYALPRPKGVFTQSEMGSKDVLDYASVVLSSPRLVRRLSMAVWLSSLKSERTSSDLTRMINLVAILSY